MEWTDIRVTVPRRWADTAEAIATGISGGGIYIEDYADLEQQVMAIAHVDLIEPELLARDRDKVIVHMYLSPEENPAQVLQLLHDRLSAAGAEYTLDTAGVEQEDWENGWKAFYHAMTIGSRLAVVPSWETMDTDRAVLRLDPGMAFGTGTHATTRLCMELLEQSITPGCTVLDVGCGSGILAVCSVLLGASHADGVDIDELAVKIAGENAALNQAADRTHFVQGDLTDKISGQYDVICANIVADVIIRLCPSLRRFLQPGGYFLASGIIDERSVEVEKAIRDCGMYIIDRREEDGWVALRCQFAEE